MLVLNRRPGGSIIIDPDIKLTVLSVVDHQVRIGLRSARVDPMLCVRAAVVAPTTVRVELGPMAAVSVEGDTVQVTLPERDRRVLRPDAVLAIDRQSGERIEIGGELWVSPSVTSDGFPCLTYGGRVIGERFSITAIRPQGGGVRLGIDAPARKVVREEIWACPDAAIAV